MTSIARRFIKTAIGFLAVGLLLGGWMLIRREMYGEWPVSYVVSAHTHAVFVGFVMFMILGVALWLFPKPARGDRRYRPAVVEAVYWLLFSGTWVRFGGELLRAHYNAPAVGWVVVMAGVSQIIAIFLYMWTMWSRIRSTTQHKEKRVGRESVGVVSHPGNDNQTG